MRIRISCQSLSLFFTILSGLLCFLPLIIESNGPRERERESHDSKSRLDFLEKVNYTTLIISSLLLCGLVTDKSTFHLSFQILLPRTIMTVFLWISSSIFYVWESTEMRIEYSICCVYMRYIIILGSLMSQIENQFQSSFQYLHLFTLFLLQASTTVVVWSQFIEFEKILQNFILFFYYLSTFCTLHCCIYCLYRIYKKFYSQDSSLLISWKSHSDELEEIQLYSCFSIFLQIVGTLLVGIYLCDPDFDDKSILEISLGNIVDFLVLVLTYHIPNRIIYRQTLKTEVIFFLLCL